MRTVYELNTKEIDELKQSLYFQFVDNGDDIIDAIDSWEDIPTSIVENHYDGIMFVNDDFFCNINPSYYNCEDGNDNSIVCFEDYEEALAYAKENERVKEIWEYEIADDYTMGDVIQLLWKRYPLTNN